MRNSVSEKAPLVKIAVSLMAGIVLAKYLVVPFPLFPLLVVVVLLAFCLWRYEQLQSAVIGLCMVVLGALLMQRAQQTSLELSRLDRSKTYFLEQRTQLLDRLSESGVDGSVYAVVAAMSLGDKSQLTKELKEVTADQGTEGHLRCVGGLAYPGTERSASGNHLYVAVVAAQSPTVAGGLSGGDHRLYLVVCVLSGHVCQCGTFGGNVHHLCAAVTWSS